MVDFFNRKQRFSIRKFNVGVVSVLLGTTLVGFSQTVLADEVDNHEPLVVLEKSPPTTNSEIVVEEIPIIEVTVTTDDVQEVANTEETSAISVVEIVEKEVVESQESQIEVTTSESVVSDKGDTNEDVLEKEDAIGTNNNEIESTTEIGDTNNHLDNETEMSVEELEKGPSNQTKIADDFLLRSTTARNAQLASSGTYHFTTNLGVKAEPKINSANLATYSAGQSVNYDRVLDSDGHRWISYIAFSGLRRYIAVQKLSTTNPLTGNDSVKNGVTAQLSQRGIELSITTNKVKDKSKILYAVWSDQKGQDDLNWYQADKSGKAVARYEHHSGYGTYHIHTYTNETGRMVGLGTQTITIAKPSMTSTITKVNDSTFTIEVKVPHYMRDVKIPVWSNKNGQDDIKWYNATHQGNGTYSLTISAQNHKSDLGEYQAHIYGNSLLENKRQIGLGKTKGFTVNRIISPYSSPNARPEYQANTYPVGQCTWGAKEAANWVNNWWGNANQWVQSAKNHGFTVGTIPTVGAVAVWPYDGDGYGHVAVVTQVTSETSIQVVESNLNGNKYLANFRGKFNPKNSGGGVVYYIYPPKS